MKKGCGKFWRLAVMMILLVPVMGSAGPHTIPGSPLENQRLRSQLASQLAQTYPAAFDSVQKITLTVGRKRFVFIGNVDYAGPGAFHATANWVGGAIFFDLLAGHGSYQMLKKPLLLPRSLLLRSVVGDINHVYEHKLNESAFLVGRAERQVSLVVPLGQGRLREYQFDQGRTPVKSLESEGGQLTREAAYAENRFLPGWPQPVPTRIRMTDYNWHYSLEIELLKLEPRTAQR